MPKEITHERRLVDSNETLGRFLLEVSFLGHKLGPLLIQLPPSLKMDHDVASRFFERLRAQYGGLAVCEPRNQSWFAEDASRLLERFEIGRVAADPVDDPRAAEPGGFPHVAYYRLHGSPRMYFSSYEDEDLESLSGLLQQNTSSQHKWCIFDNTAAGAAIGNALALIDKVKMVSQ
jgi:uncharacterized protein YecE (DUF72 family)